MIQSTTPLFTFAVITDSHINQDELECNSPFEVNTLANKRLRYIVNDLNTRELSAVFHLGDVVHPVPSMGELYSDSAQQFFDQINRLNAPFHMIPGNHDVGDKKINWGPAGTIRPDFIKAWNTHFGDDHFHVSYNDIEFIGINAQLVGSGLNEELQQYQWVERVCEKLDGKRKFLLTHYPPFLENPDEDEHYDNLAPEGRQWMMELLQRYKFEGLFAGHVHHFWFNQVANCNCYLLPATSFVRQDYSEMFRVGPAAELGRNDAPKLGYFLIHVYEDHHDFEMVRSFGEELDQFDVDPLSSHEYPVIKTINPRTNTVCGLGFDLRQDWMERVQIPPSGGLDEFDRKWVRNDYALLALWEMGIRRLRIPLQDLLIPDRAKRITIMQQMGFTFDAYQFGTGRPSEIARVLPYANILEHLEIIWPYARLHEVNIEELSRLKDKGVNIRLSPLRSKHDILNQTSQYYHVINHGLTLHDLEHDNLPDISDSLSTVISGWCFRASMDDDIVELLKATHTFDSIYNSQSVLHLRMAPDNPATQLQNDLFCEHRLAKGILTSWALNSTTLYCDALTDNDRGYFPRVGILDRLYNPKPAWQLIKYLHGILNELPLPSGDVSVQSFANGLQLHSDTVEIELIFDTQEEQCKPFDQQWRLYNPNQWAEFGEKIFSLASAIKVNFLSKH